MKRILEEYLNLLDIYIDESEKTYIIEKAKKEIEEYKKYFNVKMEEPTNLKKYYFIGLVLAEKKENKKEDIYASMLDFLYDILIERVKLESEDFLKRSIYKLLISIIKGDVEEKFGKYGIYFIFNSVIRYFDEINEKYLKLKQKYEKIKKINELSEEIIELFNLEKEIELDFDFFKEEKDIIKSETFKGGYICRYILDNRYKKAFFTNIVIDNKKIELEVEYLGEKLVEDINMKNLLLPLDDKSIIYCDLLHIKKKEKKDE